MNNYLIESTDSLSLENEASKLIKDNKFTKASVYKYDLEETELENALEDLDTYGFLSDKKVVIIENIEVLKYDDFKKDFDHLFSYIKNPNPDNLLIIESNKLNNTLKVTKELKKICKYQEIHIDLRSYMKNAFKDYKIDLNTMNLLEEYCLGDYSKLANECNKLKSYKAEEKVITKEDVIELVPKKLGDSKDLTFAFSRSLGLRDREDALKKYLEVLSYDIEPISIIGLLASQIRIIYQVKLLENKRMSDKEIADQLGEKSDYRIRKTRELTKYYSEEELLKLMQQLADMDYKMKTEDVDGNHLIEMFILNI
jgi:DNA polymerase-3 subunit delta